MTAKVIAKTLISIVFQTFFLAAWSNVLADEASPMLADLGINEAYNDCRLFVFDNKNDGVLFSSVSHFSNLSETYGNHDVHDQCIVGLRSKVLMPMSSTDAHQDGEFVNIMIVRGAYLSPSYLCEGKPDYDECLEKAVLNYNGFYEGYQGRWKRRVYNLGDAGGELEKSMSETINGTIRNSDGITVVSEWKRPYHFPDQTGSDLIIFDVIRRTPFGYVFAGGKYGIAIPVDKTEESQIKATELINRVIDVVQSVRMKNGG
ncbi:hypothetical protein [Paraburkholderia sp. 35.1]|uniref:hypothetical protein n=1 Tax=unclassified Paraburkholderia TaxID=2615204 RepID=UPI003D207662